MHSASPTVERGRDRLENWAQWSRLDSSDTGYPRKCAYWTPPRAGDVYDDDDFEALPVVDYIDAERVEAIVVGLEHASRQAVRARYIERRSLNAIARLIHGDRHRAERILVEAEQRVGRA